MQKVSAVDGVNVYALLTLFATIVVVTIYLKALLDAGRYRPPDLNQLMLTETKYDTGSLVLSTDHPFFPTATPLPTRHNPRFSQAETHAVATDNAADVSDTGASPAASVQPSMTFTWAWRTFTYTPSPSATITDTPRPSITPTPAPVREVIVTRVIDVQPPPVFITSAAAPAPAPVIIVHTSQPEVIYVQVTQIPTLLPTETLTLHLTDELSATPTLTLTAAASPTPYLEPSSTLLPIGITETPAELTETAAP